jgi:hypothetical protein
MRCALVDTPSACTSRPACVAGHSAWCRLQASCSISTCPASSTVTVWSEGRAWHALATWTCPASSHLLQLPGCSNHTAADHHMQQYTTAAADAPCTFGGGLHATPCHTCTNPGECADCAGTGPPEHPSPSLCTTPCPSTPTHAAKRCCREQPFMPPWEHAAQHAHAITWPHTFYPWRKLPSSPQPSAALAQAWQSSRCAPPPSDTQKTLTTWLRSNTQHPMLQGCSPHGGGGQRRRRLQLEKTHTHNHSTHGAAAGPCQQAAQLAVPGTSSDMTSQHHRRHLCQIPQHHPNPPPSLGTAPQHHNTG